MWVCNKCKENIKDKYNHCWNCGQPKSVENPVISEEKVKSKVERPLPDIKIPTRVEPVVKIKQIKKAESTVPQNEKAESTVPQNEKAEKKIAPIEKAETKVAKAELTNEIGFLEQFSSPSETKKPSIILKFIPFLLWLIAFVGTGVFGYLSFNKTVAFENKIIEEAKGFNSQKDQFVFDESKLPDRKNKLTAEGNIRGKVLPINRKNNEVNDLFFNLPDDLRPENTDEAKTLMWLDCESEVVGHFKDGSTGYREKCNTYLFDRETSKFIGIQDFLGVPPALTKKNESGDEIGKVLTERYVSYLREKQLEGDRSPMQYASDSPSHHFFNKSEFFFSILLLCLWGAIGLGWIAYKIKFNWDAD